MTIDRKIPPKSKVAKLFDLPTINSFSLNNGLKVYLSEKSKLPIIKMSLIIPAGSRFDGYGSEGLAYLTSLVWDEGAGTFNSLQLADEIDKLGSSINISTSLDHIYLSMTSLTENFEKTLELFSLIVHSPLFQTEDLEREKKKHIARILQSFDNPAYIAANAFQRNIFKGSLYDKPILGYSNSVAALDQQMVKDFYSRSIAQSDSMLIVVGNFETEKLRVSLNNYLSDIDLKLNRAISKVDIPKSQAKLYFIHKEKAAQSEIVAGHPSKNRAAPDHLAAKIANSILGGQFSSRINLNLREDKGYTYGAQSAISYNQHAGYFSISTSVQSEFTVQSIREIQKEVFNIGQHIHEDEIAFSKAFLVKQFPSMFETYSQLLQRITTKIIYDLDDYYESYIQSLWDLSAGDILAAANEYFRPELLSFFIVGDREILKEEIQKTVGLEFIELDKLGNVIT